MPDHATPLSIEEEILQGAPEDAAPETAALPPSSFSNDALKALLDMATSMKAMVQENQANKQIPLKDIKPVTPWNPEGKRSRLKPRGEIYQNGYLVNPLMMTEEDIELCNKLKPGRYLDRTVTVARQRDGSLYIEYASARTDQRMDFYAKYPTFTSLAAALVKDREAKEERRRRGEFDSEEAL